MFLRELRHPVSNLKGVGPATALAFKSVGVATIADLLLYFPRDYEDRSLPRPLSLVSRDAESAVVNTTVVVERQAWVGRRSGRTLKVIVREIDGGRASLVCFGRNYLGKTLLPGERFSLFGSFTWRYGELTSSNFEVELSSERAPSANNIVPIYPLTEGLSQAGVRKAVARALAEYGDHLADELPREIMTRRLLLGKAAGLRGLHVPDSAEGVERARFTLAYEELFYLQLIVGRRTLRRRALVRPRRAFSTLLQEKLVTRLPFALTADQRTALDEINRDLASDRPMARLLQGEVGSGKTLVSLLSALAAAESGLQVALMAPTELLARQHAETAAGLLAPLGVRLAFLSGNVKDASRSRLLEALRAGEIDLVVGTHALFARGVAFRRLGLVIVDEQHRFGVVQRLALVEKGETPDLLLMTATPIPRTLALTVFGDLDVSTIRTLPAGRKPVATHLAREGNEQKVYDWVRSEIGRGRQAYFVYPVIRSSESLNVKDAESTFLHLRDTVFTGFRVALCHSELGEEEKADVMRRFAERQIDVLVATSVVEVGVDAPNATVMVVEHAERFGLAALHQLRGRVGRGSERSYAFLVYGEPLSEEGKRRLKAVKETNDGFKLSEEDLRLRGPGELAGRRQSGYIKLSVANLVTDLPIVKLAREDAFDLLKKDPGLLADEHACVREVLDRAPPFADDAFEGG